MSDEVGDASGSRDGLTLTARIGAEPAVVWRSLTVRRHQWWPDMHFDAVPGAPVREEWIEHGEPRSATGVVTECRTDVALGFEWQQAEWEAPLHVAFSLVPDAHGTLVRVHETGFSALAVGGVLLDEHLEGWRFHLVNLAAHAEEGAPVR